MASLKHRLEALERQRRAVEPCPEHQQPPGAGDLSDTLRAFSPVAEDRAAYLRDQERLATTPPCSRCGWAPFVVVVQPTEQWGAHLEPVA